MTAEPSPPFSDRSTTEQRAACYTTLEECSSPTASKTATSLTDHATISVKQGEITILHIQNHINHSDSASCEDG